MEVRFVVIRIFGRRSHSGTFKVIRLLYYESNGFCYGRHPPSSITLAQVIIGDEPKS
jgi:hypothetical protein